MKIKLAPRHQGNAVRKFQRMIYRHHRLNRRVFPWRLTRDPYQIFVSEVMLQQTQAERVINYYHRFLKKFPTVATLARASLRSVLSLWQGLGYNRRAVALRKTAQLIMRRHQGRFPQNRDELLKLPGVGSSTAGALLAFAFRRGEPFIETNIRSVFIDYFFKNRENVHDEEIMPLISQMLNRRNPRRWYYALMDYGAALKKRGQNPSRRSAHHVKQAMFKGSDRELRGLLIRKLVVSKAVAKRVIERYAREAGFTEKRLEEVLRALIRDGLIEKTGKRITLAFS